LEVLLDILYFLKQRTAFIRHFYETAGQSFENTIQAIEAGTPPFDSPPDSEDPDPPYLEEWMLATDELEVLGRTCLSMLSPSLQLYFTTWEHNLGIQCNQGARKRAFRKGFLAGYKICFGEVLDLSWNDCPADLALIEQITLARNRDQHAQSLTSMRVSHSREDLAKHPHPFFVSSMERRMSEESGFESNLIMAPSIYVSRDSPFIAIAEVEKLAEWLEEKMFDRKYQR
jgi:hypothetical protein